MMQRGKFRPTLSKLIASNSEDTVLQVTKRAFEQLESQRAVLDKIAGMKKQDAYDVIKVIVDTCMDTLCELRAVGPASASGK